MYYRIRTTTSGTYEVIKFDGEFELSALYNITINARCLSTCDCPSYYQPCKHIKHFLPIFKKEGQINGTLFYNSETKLFVKETNDVSP